MVKLAFVAVFAALFTLVCLTRASVVCLNQNGNPVDWWIVYKLPSINGNSQSQNGYGYAYSDPMTSLHITGSSLQDNKGALANTLNQIYKSSSTGFIMWNDETPDGKTSSSKAHSKGVMGFDQSGGFLLRHSTPRFPNSRSSGFDGLPSNERIYGQTFLCTTTTLSSLNLIANQYLIADAQVYDSHLPSGFSNYQSLAKFSRGESISSPSSNTIQFKTTGGISMFDMVKSKHCDCDLWDAMISPYFEKPMNVLTWGRPLQSSGCPPATRFPVQNINHINWGSINYRETEEHSKWGITTDHKTICIGDINRMTSQRKRGGGATCFNSPTTASAFNKLIASVESC